MEKRNFSWACILGLSLAWSPIAISSEEGYVGFHQDYRKSPKLMIDNIHRSLVGGDAVSIANEYLEVGSKKFQWDSKHLELMKVKPSLTGTHVYFRQIRNGFPVRFGEVILSVDTLNQSIYRVYNNYFPANDSLEASNKNAILSKDQAFDIAWGDLKVHGRLQGEPNADLMYVVNEKGEFTLAYVVHLNVDAPFGAWEHVVDAASGEILSTKDTRLERKRSEMAAMRSMYKGPVVDREAAFKSFREKSEMQQKKSAARKGDASGLVFDPDPRTTLKDSSLRDKSAPELFDDAYFTVELLDLTIEGGVYTLKGPWVTIADFESPNTAPSTSPDGVWSAKRGNVAFNDVMTYYHVDKNQRYMQSLGFEGEKGIQGGSIKIDANGLGGADNSHFIPSTNQIAFGHGCVDDNEDADVILHEYGHAINYSINSNWGGGDTGAIGEGFGDYWAASYSISTLNGMDYQPEKVFNWDAHGDSNECWGGRILNALSLRYNHNQRYGAHSSMPGGRQTDELWSTPLFQALLALKEQGFSREEVDQIVLESQFGLGFGLKMRDLAYAVINAARRLQPQGPHADVFFQKFAHHNIVEAPQAILEVGSYSIDGMGDNGAIDPGETIALRVNLQNQGTLGASSINATLNASNSRLVSVTNAHSSFPSIMVGGQASNETPFTFEVDSQFKCGDKIQLDLGLTFSGGPLATAKIPLVLPTGVAQGAEAHNSTEATIPDNNPNGVSSSITVDADGNVSENFRIDIELRHTYIGDLTLTLTAPNGQEVVLHKNTGGGQDDIVGTYGDNLESAQPLSTLLGAPLAGEWKLKAVDRSNSDTGAIKNWGIRDIAGYTCN